MGLGNNSICLVLEINTSWLELKKTKNIRLELKYTLTLHSVPLMDAILTYHSNLLSTPLEVIFSFNVIAYMNK